MREYRFHWWPAGEQQSRSRIVTLEAESQLHGAALALQHFAQLGCDIRTPLAHMDITDASGAKHTMTVEEILDWVNDAPQREFIERAGLSTLAGDVRLSPPSISQR